MSHDLDTQEYYDRLKLNHTEQVEAYGWCMCADGGHVSEGCPQ